MKYTINSALPQNSSAESLLILVDNNKLESIEKTYQINELKNYLNKYIIKPVSMKACLLSEN
jgi:hypothetical protein